MPISRITSKLQNPGAASVAALIIALLVATAAWGSEHVGHGHIVWEELCQPEHAFSYLGVIASVLGAWFFKSPVKQ